MTSAAVGSLISACSKARRISNSSSRHRLRGPNVIAPHVSAQSSREVGEKLAMTITHGKRLARFLESKCGIVAHGFTQPVSNGATTVVRRHHGIVDQLSELIDD